MVWLLIRGAIAGFAATVPMTLVMLAMHRSLPREREMPLAPQEVTEGVAEVAGVEDAIPPPAFPPVEIAAHFGYGAAAGTIYQLLLGSRFLARIAFGMTFGFAVWAGSYLGYIPALGIRRPAYEDPAERNLTMIAAHLAWGAALGMLASWAWERQTETAQTGDSRKRVADGDAS